MHDSRSDFIVVTYGRGAKDSYGGFAGVEIVGPTVGLGGGRAMTQRSFSLHQFGRMEATGDCRTPGLAAGVGVAGEDFQHP